MHMLQSSGTVSSSNGSSPQGQSNLGQSSQQHTGAAAQGHNNGVDSSSSQQSNCLTDDMRMAIKFRCQRKLVLKQALTALGDRVKAVAAMKGLKSTAVDAPRKGEKPKAATDKGFGRR
eukprot:jgi/Chrzof1/7828/Cz02g38020.t1